MKRLNKKGFTMAELLIVVAIIAVLVAIAIPIFSAQLEKSRDAVSIANLRSAYAEASTAYLSESTGGNVTNVDTSAKTVTVKDVKLQGKTSGWSNANDNLSFTIDTAAGLDGDETGTYTVTFKFNDDGTVSLTGATAATATP